MKYFACILPFFISAALASDESAHPPVALRGSGQLEVSFNATLIQRLWQSLTCLSVKLVYLFRATFLPIVNFRRRTHTARGLDSVRRTGVIQPRLFATLRLEIAHSAVDHIVPALEAHLAAWMDAFTLNSSTWQHRHFQDLMVSWRQPTAAVLCQPRWTLTVVRNRQWQSTSPCRPNAIFLLVVLLRVTTQSLCNTVETLSSWLALGPDRTQLW